MKNKYIIAINPGKGQEKQLFGFDKKKDLNSFIKDIEKAFPNIQYAVAKGRG